MVCARVLRVAGGRVEGMGWTRKARICILRTAMDLPSYDNYEKWKKHFAGLLKRSKNRVLLGIVLVGIICGYFALYRPVKEAKANAEKKEEEIRGYTKTIGDLRFELQSLRSSNATYEIILDPVRRIAREVHPEMETAAAVAELGKDLQEVRALATRDVFRALEQTMRSNLVSRLCVLGAKYGTNRIKIEVGTQSGGKNRASLADEWVSILKDAGMDASRGRDEFMMWPGAQPDVSMAWNEGAQGLGEAFAGIMQDFFSVKFRGVRASEDYKGDLRVEIVGEPLFLVDGRVVFR